MLAQPTPGPKSNVKISKIDGYMRRKRGYVSK